MKLIEVLKLSFQNLFYQNELLKSKEHETKCKVSYDMTINQIYNWLQSVTEKKRVGMTKSLLAILYS